MHCANCKSEWAREDGHHLTFIGTENKVFAKLVQMNEDLVKILENIGMPLKRSEDGVVSTADILSYVEKLSNCCDKPNIFFTRFVDKDDTPDVPREIVNE